MREGIKVYTILRTAIDSDRGDFPPPDAVASFLSLEKAKTKLRGLVEETERSDTLNPALNKRDSGEDYWEAYEEGNETARYCRLEILTSELKDAQEETDGSDTPF